ncbi:MAG: hypothetical protein ACLGJD_24310 [Gammaproteobacteria bacterium]|uniref:PD-(D/E)XK nuclease domain-containing protein n=1 Tax=uncultured Pseudacidovorax sp. TaxID=679313 RepID=UPI0025D7DE84|nr:hypothetical protein [uncultured Pseudacidovorax sp.]
MSQFLLNAALSGARDRAASLLDAEPLQRTFLAWMQPGLAVNRDWAGLASLLSDQLKAAGRSTQAVAALGFLVAAGQTDVAAEQAFGGGVEWVVGRRVVESATSQTLAHPLVLLGITVGTLAKGDASAWQMLKDWYAGLTDQFSAPRGETTPNWQSQLADFVQQWLALDMATMLCADQSNLTVLAMARHGLAKLELAGSDADATAASMLDTLLRQDFGDAEEAALCVTAYEYLAATCEHPRLRAPDLHDVALALARLQAAMRRWTWEDAPKVPGGSARRWHIDHEYHFQNLLTAVFTPLFADLKDEEWLSSLGPKKPRADLVVPSLKLVIEVKFWRANVSASAMVSQIAEDVGLYRKKGSPYLHIVPVIWDDAGRAEQHAYLVSGLDDLQGVVHPTIVSRPASMVHQTTQVASGKVRKSAARATK